MDQIEQIARAYVRARIELLMCQQFHFRRTCASCGHVATCCVLSTHDQLWEQLKQEAPIDTISLSELLNRYQRVSDS
jgi:hypothetical protein